MLDQFYTKETIVIKCIKEILDIDDYDIIVEPSAGTGSFSNNLNKCIPFDLEPKGKGIIKKNWLEVSSDDIGKGNILIVGNPPFGNRSKLAKDFIIHSIKLNATTIAFILPKTFSKYSNQKVFPKDWRLIKEIELPRDSFIYDGNTKHVPCSFYIWTKKKGSINLRQKEYKVKGNSLFVDNKKEREKIDFTFLKRGDIESDFCINGNSGKIKDIENVTNLKSEHYIKAINIDREELKKRFNSLKFKFSSSVEGGNAWMGQQEILETYYSKY